MSCMKLPPDAHSGQNIARAVLNTCFTHTDTVGSTPSVGQQIALVTLEVSLVNTHTHIFSVNHILSIWVTLTHTASHTQ